MKPTVYIETTIAGHLCSRLPKDPLVAGQMIATRQWWNDALERFELCTSEIVIGEASQGDPQAAAERLEKIGGLAWIPIGPAVAGLAELLLARSALPAKARVDAVHVAVAATNSIQYLLTWNCKHLANATLRSRIEETCREFGYIRR